MLNADLGVGCGSAQSGCSNSGDCPKKPDLCIKRNDTRPSFKMSISDCEGVVDLTDENLVLEASMWFDTKTKTALTDSSTTVQFADNIGFEQVMVGDVIVTGSTRNPEKMSVFSVDEDQKTITVSRGHAGTTARQWPKGTQLHVFRFADQTAEIQSFYEDITNVDGSVASELSDTLLVFNWEPEHTEGPGCYWIEFKLARISPDTGDVEWTKKIPLESEGFMVNIIDSPN